MSVLDNLRDQIANHLLTHVGGDETQPWQAGHNYAMTEAARLVRERWDQLGQGDEAVRDMVADTVEQAIQQATSTKARSYMSEEDIAIAVSGAVEELLGLPPRTQSGAGEAGAGHRVTVVTFYHQRGDTHGWRCSCGEGSGDKQSAWALAEHAQYAAERDHLTTAGNRPAPVVTPSAEGES